RRESFEFIPEARTIPAETPPVIVSHLQPATFRAGEPLKLRCRVDGLPRPDVVWTKDEIQIEQWVMEKEIITHYYPDGTCELINPECALEDAGIYQLTARNVHGTAETSAYIQVQGTETITTVEETTGEFRYDVRQLPLKPRFSEVLSRQYEHETVVSCLVLSDVPVQVTWFKDGKRLLPSYKHRMESRGNMHILTICDVDKLDEGFYTCQAENRYGNEQTSIYVRAPVQTREVSEEMLVEESTDEVVGFKDRVDYVKKVRNCLLPRIHSHFKLRVCALRGHLEIFIQRTQAIS
ncbi:unnamed protein product, partial [Gongylonema pulchrum]|uniref:Ig-like domain-containing protein n=1 Tax=Gongylonema pulchrum TaxID=637853 RepID=A0A183DPJ6_9BILA